ncbi:MAG: thioredoxin family protein [Pseudomonadota bacterium]
MSALIDSKPEYRNVRIIRVDWDKFRRSPIVRELRIPRRSTWVAFKDGKEQHRVVAQTSSTQLEKLFAAVL